MGEASRIEWTDHTFNPWWGCVKVTAAFKNCYAEAFAKRVGQRVWGPKANRRFFGDKHWAEPVKWNARAEALGTRARVFCASMADVFENRRDLDNHRARLWQLIGHTPNLDWLLLTKRPEHIRALTTWGRRWPHNVWLGVTVEDQAAAEARLPILTQVPCAVRFVSAEPLIEAVDLSPWLDRLNWVITGGESGVRARPSCPSHFRQLRDQCVAAGIAFHFKQWGEYAPLLQAGQSGRIVQAVDETVMQRVGKKAAGRKLDRTTWDQWPTPRH